MDQPAWDPDGAVRLGPTSVNDSSLDEGTRLVYLVLRAFMRLRAGNHRASAATRAFTVAVMAAATFAQLLSISHEMTVRHFRCAEHGELTHVAPLVAGTAAMPARSSNDSFRPVDSEAADGHEHCGVAFTIEGSSCTSSPSRVIGTVSPPPAPRPDRAVVPLIGRVGVLASAPKTSPPSA
jgi:hypothetical protein